MRDQSKLAKGRFTGDPSYEYEHVETKKLGEGDDATEEEETVSGAQISAISRISCQKKMNEVEWEVASVTRVV